MMRIPIELLCNKDETSDMFPNPSILLELPLLMIFKMLNFCNTILKLLFATGMRKFASKQVDQNSRTISRRKIDME